MYTLEEAFCIPEEGEPDLPFAAKRRNRFLGYLATLLFTFVLGTTEIFAPWYTTRLGGSSFEAGWAMASFGLVYMISPVIGGKFSDRIGRKKSVLISSFAYAMVLILYLFPMMTPLFLILIRGLEGLVYGFIIPAIEGMVAELSPDAQGRVLGHFSTSWSAGMIFSPLAIAYSISLYGELSSIYIVLAVELITLGVISRYLTDYRCKTVLKGDSAAEIMPEGPIASSKTSPIFLASYLSIMLWGVVSTVIIALFPAYIESLPMYFEEDFGLLLMAWNIVRTGTFILCTKMHDDFMPKAIIIGAALSGVSSGLFSYFTDYWILMAAMAISGVGVGLSYLGALYIVVSATDLEKGSHAGLVESMGGIGLFIGPVAGGWLADILPVLPYVMCAVLSCFVFIGIVVLTTKHHRNLEPKL